MSEEKRGIFNRFISGLDLVRRIVLNIVFFALLIGVLSFIFSSSAPDVPSSAVLALNPVGDIVDELKINGVADGIKNIAGFGGAESLLKDLTDAIYAAKNDDRIKVLLLETDSLGAVGLTKLQDLRQALLEFKKSGKKIIAASDNYSRNGYYLASLADEIYIHPMGMVTLEGYGRYQYYYKEGLDKLEVEMNIFRVGRYKSAVEPFLLEKMSDDARAASEDWMGDLWRNYLADVAAARKVPSEKLTRYMDQWGENMAHVSGDAARMAKDAGLVDHIAYRDEIRERLISMVGEDSKNKSYKRMGYRDYLLQLDEDEDRWGADVSGDVVAVVVAKGSILDGHQPPGSIGGDSTAELIRKARNDKHVKAIVLKVDSGGGSAFASDVILRELEMARRKKIPVVTSMGSVAASGGYWISMSSDQVWAYPSTITGSIGIFGMFPSYYKPLKKHLGIQVDGVGTNRMASGIRGDMPLDPEMGRAIQLMIEKGYNEFITKAAKARQKTPEEIHAIAQGRVWSGEDAKRLGLVDRLGSFDEALKAAAKLAHMKEDFKVKYFRREPSLGDTIVNSLMSRSGKLFHADAPNRGPAFAPFSGGLRILMQQAEMLSAFNDPNGVYAWCGAAAE